MSENLCDIELLFYTIYDQYLFSFYFVGMYSVPLKRALYVLIVLLSRFTWSTILHLCLDIVYVMAFEHFSFFMNVMGISVVFVNFI